MHRVLTSKCQRVIQRRRYHIQDQIIRAIRNALVVTLIPLHERQSRGLQKNARRTKNHFIPADRTAGIIFSISIARYPIYSGNFHECTFQRQKRFVSKILTRGFVRQVAADTDIGRRARIYSSDRFSLSPPLDFLSLLPALRRLISPTTEEMKSRPGRDSRDVCPVIRSALLRASSRECSAAVEYVFRV